MASTTLTADVIAKEALYILDNELGWINKLHRAHESEYGETVNGYKKGSTISIRRPADYTVRSGATMDLQDSIEGKTTLVVDQQKGVDFSFSSTDLTLSVADMSERYIKPAMTSIVNNMANDVLSVLYQGTYNWVGTPTSASAINSFADFAKAPERLDLMSTPVDGRCAVMHPQDHWGLVGAQTALFTDSIVAPAFRKGYLGEVGGIPTYMSQVAPTHTVGSLDATTPLIDGAGQEVTYDTAKNTWTQTLTTDGWDSSATIAAGDVFTIDTVFMVNAKTKASTGILQQFVVTTAVTADETTTNDTDLTIAPPIILSGPHQTVTISGGTLADGATITPVGTASTAYRQNLVFHKNAMSLAVVPMEMPQGAVNGSRKSYKGISVRVIPVYDAVNDLSKWRLDLLYGRALIDPRMSVRLTATT